ncbi:MAG: efflux transporter outer membrane subunit [Smithella sp.]|jgi:NodT family efflux transporter outer membrane factor (OMF) lipoprotein
MKKLLVLKILLVILMVISGCSVGPDYKRPDTPVPSSFKELKGWRQALPRDQEIRTKWWETFGDPILNSLVEQISVSNQSIALAESQYRQAQALVPLARANYFPTVSAGAAYTHSLPAGGGGTYNSVDQHQVSLNAAWEVDLWGKVRRQVESSKASAEASFADLQAMRLSMQAELALNYFQLRILDAQKKNLEEAVAAYGKALELTQNRYKAGVAAKADVAAAQTQLESTQAQAIDVGVQRAQLEHAIAILTGKPPADFSLTPIIFVQPQIKIPVAIPSDLLERRPDIASAERKMAAANAQIGVAKAAYYPTLSLSGSLGYASTELASLFTSPSFFWALGPTALSATLFDGGARKAQTEQAMAAYDGTVAFYRQTVLTGFQDVEDNLAALRILDEEAQVQEQAVKSAQESAILTTNQYKAGIVSYLNVVTAQTIALTNERAAISISGQRLNAAVLLVKALGGGWRVPEAHGVNPATLNSPAPSWGENAP